MYFSPEPEDPSPRRTSVMVWAARLLIVAYGPCVLFAPLTAGPLMITAAAAMLLAFSRPGARLPKPTLLGLFVLAALADLTIWAGLTAFWADETGQVLTHVLELFALHAAGATILFSAHGAGILSRAEWPQISAFGGIAALSALLAAPYAGFGPNALWLILFFWIAVTGLVRWAGPLAAAAFAFAGAALLWRSAGVMGLAAISYGGLVGALAGRSVRVASFALVAPLVGVVALVGASLLAGSPVAALEALIDATRLTEMVDLIKQRPWTGLGFGSMGSDGPAAPGVPQIARLWLEVGAIGIGLLLVFGGTVAKRLSGPGAGRRDFDTAFAVSGGWLAAAVLIPGGDWLVWTALSWILALAVQVVPGSLVRSEELDAAVGESGERDEQ